jgi:DNA-directed RNA polymerase subunit H
MLFLGDMLVEKEFNVLTHELVPEHTILKDSEKKQVLEKFNITPEQLPKILKNDPAAKEIGAKEGDIIKIIRKSPTAGRTTYYRLIIKK